jgi:hypothetical protein
VAVQSESALAQSNGYLFNDSHFHLTNYIQEGIGVRDFLNIMGTKAGRVALFGIPLQQQWSYRVDGDHAPAYYLNSDAPLYYYSFTDAWIAMAYKSLSPDQQPFRPHDHRVQSHGYVRRRPCSTRAADFPGSFFRNRRVYHSPRVRFREDRRGSCQPGGTRLSTDSWTSLPRQGLWC